MAELADAEVSKTCIRKGVWVRFPPPALDPMIEYHAVTIKEIVYGDCIFSLHSIALRTFLDSLRLILMLIYPPYDQRI